MGWWRGRICKISIPLTSIITACLGNNQLPSNYGRESTSIKKDYAIFFDAGSSATRAFVYAWEAREYTSDILYKGPPEMVRPFRIGSKDKKLAEFMEITPGVSSYAVSPEKLRKLSHGFNGNNGLFDLISWAKEQLASEGVTQPSRLAGIPLYVGCTGGVRMLPLKQKEDVVEELRHVLVGPTSKSPFLKSESFIRMLAGEEEGIYGWLASNYLLGTLGTTHTYGILDLGGASTQFTFVPTTEDMLTNTYEVTLTPVVGGRVPVATPQRPGTVRVYTHSFLYFGQEQSMRRLDVWVLEKGGAAALEQAQKDDGEVEHPCMPTGSRRKWKPAAAPFLQEYLHDDTINPSASMTFKGTSDFEGCYALIRLVIGVSADGHSLTPCYEGAWPNLECRMGNQYVPPVPNDMPFLAVASFFYLSEFLRPEMDQSAFTEPFPLSVWKTATKSICAMNFQAVVEYNDKLPKKMPHHFLDNYCALGVFAHCLLTQGYGFPETSRQIQPVDSIHGYQFDIGFGFILKHANSEPWKLISRASTRDERWYMMLTMWMGFLGSVLGGCTVWAIVKRSESCSSVSKWPCMLRPITRSDDLGVQLVDRNAAPPWPTSPLDRNAAPP